MPQNARGAVSLVPHRDQITVATCVLVLAALCWLALYGLSESMSMPGMDEADMPIPPWSAMAFAVDFAMWETMMIGMMLPGALPVILLYRRVVQAQTHPAMRVGVFVSAYLVAWSGFSLAATLAQEILQHRAWVSLMSVHAAPALGAALLAVAGIYQFLPAKDACLANCRSPLSFLMRHSLQNLADSWRAGLAHGAYCLGCCWALMLVLFAVGAMNMLWAAFLGIFVLLEKLVSGPWLSRLAGALLIAAAIALLTA